MSQQRVYGIDLGTTYSCIAYVNASGEPTIIPNAESSNTTASVVYFEDKDASIVGEVAKRAATVTPSQGVALIKRYMGKEDYSRSILGEEFTPQMLSALILKKIAADAKHVLHEEVKDVVITCPAYFGQAERDATKQAGEIAGLNVLGILPEPTAAAISYGMGSDASEVVLVYDLGGGTFDLSLVALRDGDVRVLTTGGDDQLGGVNWDQAIIDYYLTEFENQTDTSGSQIRKDPEAFAELVEQAERDKRSLTSRSSVKCSLAHEGERARFELTRDQFDQMTHDQLDRTIVYTRQVLERSQTEGHPSPSKILLVGGSTAMPQVEARLRQEFPSFLVEIHDPHLAVAKGAALYALKGEIDRIMKQWIRGTQEDSTSEIIRPPSKEQIDAAVISGLLPSGVTGETAKKLIGLEFVNAASRSFGVKVLDPAGGSDSFKISNLVFIDDPLPRENTRTYATSMEGQTAVVLEVYQNQQRPTADQLFPMNVCDPKTPVGTAELNLSRAVPQGSPIEVTLHLDRNGLLQVTGKSPTTGAEIRAEFKTQNSMDEEDLNRARKQVGNLAVS